MAESRAAYRYVKSLLSLAVERNVLEEVHNDMQEFARLIDENREFELMVNNPIIKHDKKLAIFNALFKGRFNALTLAILELISKKYREPILPAIAREFHNAYNDYKGIGKAYLTTATPIDEKLRTEFREMVKSLIRKSEIEMIEKVDPELIGGFVLKVGDRQVDTSIKSKLNALQVEFSKNPYIKEY